MGGEKPKAGTKVLQALAVVLELTQTSLSEAAVRVMAADLARYPELQVLGALDRCRKELRPREFTLSAVISRLDDGRPGPEEAWAMVPRDEATSVVWTDEIAQAWGVARPLLIEGDAVAGRMAFLESYRRLVQAARDAGVRVMWRPALGTDPAGREAALLDAARRGRISHEHAVSLLPYREQASPEVGELLAGLHKQLEKALA